MFVTEFIILNAVWCYKFHNFALPAKLKTLQSLYYNNIKIEFFYETLNLKTTILGS